MNEHIKNLQTYCRTGSAMRQSATGGTMKNKSEYSLLDYETALSNACFILAVSRVPIDGIDYADFKVSDLEDYFLGVAKYGWDYDISESK